jgi:hypothetical protein
LSRADDGNWNRVAGEKKILLRKLFGFSGTCAVEKLSNALEVQFSLFTTFPLMIALMDLWSVCLFIFVLCWKPSENVSEKINEKVSFLRGKFNSSDFKGNFILDLFEVFLGIFIKSTEIFVARNLITFGLWTFF